MNPVELLRRITETVGYVRLGARRDVDATLEWLSCGELVSDPGRLVEVVRSTGPGRGTDRDDIAMSLFAQAYAFRIASAALGGWLLSDGERVLDLKAANTSIALGRHRPNAVALNHVKFGSGSIHEILIDRHLRPFVDAAHTALADQAPEDTAPDDTAPDDAAPDLPALEDHERRRVGRPLLWGNLATGCASAFGAFHGAVADPAAVRDAADRFFAEGPAELRAGGRFVTYQGESVEPGWFWERTTCCLWNQIPPVGDAAPFVCEDCSLRTDADRRARYIAATAAAAD